MATPVIHIVDRFDVPWSGSAHEALAIYELLRSQTVVRLWSPMPPDASYSSFPIDTLREDSGHQPLGGTLILVGGYYELGSWLENARPERIIVKYNLFAHRRFFGWLAEFDSARLPAPDLTFPSHLLKAAVAMDGMVDPSPIDIERFRPASSSVLDRFTIGRLSRDVLPKHHEDDLSLYKMLALSGCGIRVMGGTCLGEYLTADAEGIDLLAAGEERADLFLQSLDCFFYRTGAAEETFGRVVLEAMATGLPVVCHRRGGYTEWIQNGENGFLFDTQEEAFELTMALRADPEMRLRIGQAARQTAVELFGEAARDKRRRWYLGIS